MVCSLGIGRMDVMAKFLAAGSFSQTIADDFGRSAAEYICRELREADEANLLDEEDMHVYGQSPMTDLLQLVCCNFCKKPIKDSQYASHAELCRSLKLTEQTSLELDGSTGNRKPPRKEKKKLSTSCAPAAVREQRKYESMDNIDTGASQSPLNSQVRVTAFSNVAKDATPMMEDTRTNPGNRDHPASVMNPPTKRRKATASTYLPLPETHVTEYGVTKTASFTDGFTCKDLLDRTVSEHEDLNQKNLGLVHEQLPAKNDFPAPLATKIYYSQRRNRLRASIRHLYFQNMCEELHHDVSQKMSPVQDSSQMNPSFERMDNVPNKESNSPALCQAQNSCQILAKSSEISMLKEGPPSGGLSNQFLVDNVSRSAATHTGLTRSNFLSKPYSFASNTGNPLGTIQQPNGSVPVI
ncbi:hypothetical protein HN51_003660 [Arachis hypogaea]|uniref:uncharacterized protein isoform X1 n=1 Tax=Arachis hypogaea TaxID=3818 RepID=UPI000DEC4582|nr:uncharacterized protein LOC112795778 isoform X1 [Arachis hypogaea]XP_025693712.1 uncharacterized protein LOC112795778 isoform X1 [Arachis hypogaea]XP_029153556.1 uncharacterized protein LOC112795778 isoform X1 [Arachis hypogaea]QHO37173.1 hypothetical protein DS421_4g109240 [Arachis hypogaea]